VGSLTVGILVGLIAVLGLPGLSWLRARRLLRTGDDPSVLLAAPPPSMTPATAVVVDGGPTRLAFLTALLDLASRGEIAFEEEGVRGGTADVGIEIRGSAPVDPRLLLNRREPAGEAEAWLLGQVRLAASARTGIAALTGGFDFDRIADVAATGEAMLGALARDSGTTAADDLSAQAVSARQRGLLADGGPDAASVADAYEAQTGHALPARASAMLTRAATAAQTVRAADDTDDTDDAAGALGAGLPARYLSAEAARRLSTPFLFGTFVETYARRHGWLGALPIVVRIRWRIMAVVAGAVGIAILSNGVGASSDFVTGIGTGALFGGIATYAIAPRMRHPTAAGGQMRAQLAAYRRTLQATFRSASTLGDAVGPGGLPWLVTPDQAIVWGFALGLTPDIVALLGRNPAAGASGEQEGLGRPAWYRLRRGRGAGGGSALPSASPAAMFAGIMAIGGAGRIERGWNGLFRSWWT